MKILKSLLSFVIPVTASFAGIFFYLGAAAFLGLGIFIAPVVVGMLLCGLIGLALRYAIPALTRFVVKTVIESKIKRSLVENNADKDNLKKWLVIANDGQVNDELWKFQFSDKQSLVKKAISESDHELLVYKNSTFKKLNLHHYLKSQSYIKGLLQVWGAKPERNKIQPPSSFGFFEKLLLKLKKISGINFDFKSHENIFDESHVFTALKASGIGSHQAKEFKKIPNAPTTFSSLNLTEKNYADLSISIREKYTPTEILNSPNLVRKRLFAGEEKDNKNLKKTQVEAKASSLQQKTDVPPHMHVWKNTAYLSQEVAHTHQLEQAVMAEHAVKQDMQQLLQANIEVTVEQTMIAQKNTSRWLDMSTAVLCEDMIKKAGISMTDTLSLANPFRILYEHLFKAVKTYYKYQVVPKEVSEKNIFISDNALSVLLQANKINSDNLHNAIINFVSLNDLPLGFFVEEDNNNFILKFSNTHREHQLNTLADVHIRADIYPTFQSNNENTPRVKERFEHKKFDEELDGIPQLTIEQKKFIKKLPSFNNYLQKILYTDQAHFVEFIKVLMQFDKCAVVSSSWKSINNNKQSLLENFLHVFLVKIRTGNEFNSVKVMNSLRRLCELNADELACFFQSQNYSFNFIYENTFYFIDFFRIRKLPFPAFNSYPGDYFSSLPGLREMVNCISLAGKNSANGQALQARFALSLPHGLLVGQLFLNRGYSFVHQSMFIDEHTSENIVTNEALRCPIYWIRKFEEHFKEELSDLVLIKKDEFQKIEYRTVDPHKLRVYPEDEKASYRATFGDEEYTFLYYRALYLRYVAINVHPDYIQLALNKWEQITNSPIDYFLLPLVENLKWSHSGVEKINVEINTKLAANWAALRQFISELPQKFSLQEEKSDSSIQESKGNRLISADAINLQEKIAVANEAQKPSKNSGRIIYTDLDIQELLPQLNLDKAVEENLVKNIQHLRALASHYYYLDSVTFEKRLKEAGSKLRNGEITILDCLALLQELNYRITCAKSKDKTGEWLRLEQLVLVLLSLDHPTLGQLDTGEGKTLVMQLSVCLKALSGKKVDLITHNEFLATEAHDKMALMCSLLGIKTAQKTHSVKEIEAADIFCVDISAAILNDLLFQRSVEQQRDKSEVHAWNRKVTEAILDEVDNITIDINAKTKMQVAACGGEADPELEQFLEVLNVFIRNELIKKVELNKKEAQFDFIRAELNKILNNNSYYSNLSDAALQEWIAAAVVAMDLKNGEDYFVNYADKDKLGFGVVQIVHKDTTGRVDKLSRWGAGVHQCIEIYEKKIKKNPVKVSGVSRTLAENTVSKYLQTKYTIRHGFTATLGEIKVFEQIKAILNNARNSLIQVILPRAKKAAPEGVAWQIESNNGALKTVYSRRYWFPPQILSQDEYLATLLEVIKFAQETQQSCAVFVNTINETEVLYQFLNENKIDNIQIFDDTSSDKDFSDLRPLEATMQERAREPGMITIATGAAGRGNNFPKLDIGLIVKPDLARNTGQKGGRPGRNDKFAVIYEIYSQDDLPAVLENKNERTVKQDFGQANFRFFITPYQQEKQAVDLLAIENANRLVG